MNSTKPSFSFKNHYKQYLEIGELTSIEDGNDV